MMNPVFVAPLALLIVLGGGAALVLWLDSRAPGTKTKKREQWEQEQQARDKARCAEIEEGVQAWLKMLELPQLEEQTKLEAVARQLRIVLVERLMHGPRVR
jgi:hypothetical protein